MANFKATLTIETHRGTLSGFKSGSYSEVVLNTQIVDNSDSFINLVSGSTSKGQSTLSACKAFILKNSGVSGAEIQLKS